MAFFPTGINIIIELHNNNHNLPQRKQIENAKKVAKASEKGEQNRTEASEIRNKPKNKNQTSRKRTNEHDFN